MIEGAYNKNQVHPWYRIGKTAEIPDAIDWDNGQVGSQRMGLKNRKYYTWSMRSIKAIVNGDAVNENDMSDYVKAMNIFKERNPELLMVEQVKPRSIVYDIEQWSFGRNVPAMDQEEIYEVVNDYSSEDETVMTISSEEDGICETCSDSSVEL